MTKEDYIKYWLKTSDHDWKRFELLVKGKDYVFALFCLHLSIEKLAKGLWVKEHKSNFPPRIHNLLALVEKSSLAFSEEQLVFLDQLNQFQLEGRYPDYQGKIHKIATSILAKEFSEKAKEFRLCIQRVLG